MASDIISSVSPATDTLRPPEPASTQRTRAAAANESGKESAAGGNPLPNSASRKSDVEMPAVEAAVSKLSDYVQNYQRDLRFSVDQATGRTVIKVVDSETDEVIRQIPPEHVLKLVQRLESLDSLMFEEQA